MKNLNVTSLAFLVAAFAACSIRVNSDGSSTPRSAAPPPPRPAAAAPAAAPAPAAAAPAPGRRGVAFGRAVAHPTPAPAPAQGPALGTQHVAPQMRATSEALNLAKIQALHSRNPKACGWVEVVPQKWIKIDCHAYAASRRAVRHLSARKLKVVVAHQAQWKPLHLAKTMLGGKLMRPGGGAVSAGGAGAGGAGDVKADSFPNTVDHRTDGTEGPVKDQGPVGSCTAFSLSAAIDNQAIRAGKETPNNRNQAASPNHVWSGYGIPQMSTAADSNIGRSIATLAVWPENNVEACKIANADYETECGFETNVTPGTWQSDSTLMAKYNKAQSGGSYKIASLESLQTLPPNMEEILDALASGNSLWIAMKIDGYAFSNSKMKAGVIPDWTTPNGGHALELAGYRETPQGRQFLLHNSWGTSWGDGGYAWVSENMIDKYMSYAYKVKLEGGVAQQNLTDDDCSPDDLIDIATGQCALICSDGSRPNNGCGHK